MARWSGLRTNFTPVGVADTSAMTAAGFMAWQGGNGTQRWNLWEVYMGGLAGASSPSIMIVARDSTVFAGATSNAAKLTPLDPATANLATQPLVQDVGSTTLPQRSSTLYLLNLAFNAFGGIVRWVMAPGEEVGGLGNTQPNGEMSLSALNSGTPGLMSAHFICEVY